MKLTKGLRGFQVFTFESHSSRGFSYGIFHMCHDLIFMDFKILAPCKELDIWGSNLQIWTLKSIISTIEFIEVQRGCDAIKQGSTSRTLEGEGGEYSSCT